MCTTKANLLAGVTAQWVDRDFVLYESLLSFQHLIGKHDGENLGTAIYNILDSFHIVDKLFCVTTDNASNNMSTLQKLQNLMLIHKGIKWDYKVHHVRCMNHCINLGVQTFLKTYKVLTQVEAGENEDLLSTDEDENEPTVEEMEERAEARKITGTPHFRKAVEVATEGFQATMWKLRETGKVYLM